MNRRLKQQTIDTYNQSAAELAAYFSGIGSRAADIARAFSYFPNDQHPHLRVVEIGCGNGRDAKNILRYTSNYIGSDVSSSMVDLARKSLPEATFVVADLETYDFPPRTDIIFAFASLLHSDKKALAAVLKKAHAALSPNGIFYISLKQAPYREEKKTDRFGTRTFYFYEPGDIQTLAKRRYTTEYLDSQVRDVNWFTIALMKR